jgi:sugar fermentation stimulation protein A
VNSGPELRERTAGEAVRLSLPAPLLETRFVERPNRFLLRCQLPIAVAGVSPRAGRGAAARAGAATEARAPGGDPGAVVAVHLPDPGRLRELLVPGRRVWIRGAQAPRRKTEWSAVLVETPDGGGLVSLDTTLPNRLIHLALRAGALPELAGWSLQRAEVPIGGSRLDFLLANAHGRQLALEVKSVTLVEGDLALFPDAVTTRGARHVRELATLAAADGWAAALLFVLQRGDATRIRAAAAIDPDFAAAVAEARAAGVRVLGRRCAVSLGEVRLGGRVEVD